MITLTSPDGSPSNAVAKELCYRFGLQQCIVMGFSDANQYEIVGAGSNDEDSKLVTDTAVAIGEAINANITNGEAIKIVT